ncbi:hypothetical protein K457DRAFT_134993 [Linnemannia elongata AG-77]|uniref:Porphobilinogen synthase n=1 Tax=Linnemannia elongata AG-77 TaxID=1314771 RepID=A0A197K5Y3_9FUNG|nr:hypothetical protein K457DRAFT_134993 [Linnemannia elongata AG-77]
MLMYPIFVTDNDDVEEKIDTLPGQSRYASCSSCFCYPSVYTDTSLSLDFLSKWR